jgi:hypothetical protein
MIESIAMKTTDIEALSIRRQRYAERHAETSDSDWDWLYRIGGAASLLVAVCIPIQILVFIIWPRILRRAPGYARYQRATSRTIPLVRLVPLGSSRAALV